ncbi:zinc finger and BTB domain-containing protein 34-like isoform X8 [Physella acuta]|uniref:zinc finger and BTB domain-containing protein 34-like isoform X8 n=1 Tax=Physella acuta TaxID=109671 RepID=UPI0027DC90BF|nr:zinc finger and BTB domain-containing protein 34-like isoform X8 [Physella acuta]
MDYDSSTKFISSLAKFLQSLCNGYVEFDNGVQVIGHLYLSVDTGKTIDYILNEKVCKTDENSVTFISNSFHAQPAERPKPHKKSHDKAESKSEEVNESILGQAEPKSTNYGTLPHRGAQNSPHSQNLKRSFSPSLKNLKSEPSPSKSGRQSPRHKKIRTEPLDQNLSSQTSNPASENSIPSQPSPAAESVTPATLTAPNTDVSHGTNYNEPYQQSFFHPGDDENSMAEESEERDIKPSIDTDVTFIKEEFASSSSCSQSGNQSRDRSHGDDSALYPVYQSNSAFPAVNFPGQASFGAASGSQRSNFNTSGDRSAIYTSGSSQMDGGESSGDPSAFTLRKSSGLKNSPVKRAWFPSNQHRLSCEICHKSFITTRDYIGHKNARHLNVKPFLCSFCGNGFAYKRSVDFHQKNGKCPALINTQHAIKWAD